MEYSFRLTSTSPAAAILRPSSLTCATKKNRNGELRAKPSNGDDPILLQSAIANASLRFQESQKPEPLLIDPYAGCFLSPNDEFEMNMKQQTHHHCVATKFIDDRILSTMKDTDGIKQVVLFTDGMDTRPYRLKWPNSTLIFVVSPKIVFKTAAQKLEDVGAKIARSCLLRHIPIESSDVQHSLRSKGFNGARPSIWAFQGGPLMNITSFEDILFTVSSLAMKGSLLFGEFPGWLAETDIGTESTRTKLLDKLFMCHGFRVEAIDYDEVAHNLSKEPSLGEYKNILFVAEHLRFSDDELETWRREFERIEDEGDEDGFDEL